MATDYYELLGVARTATPDELKKAYRKRARALHPDANPDDPEAEAQFKELSTAYAVLSDEDKRRRYDQFGEAGVNGAGGAGGVNFEDVFGGAGLGDIFDAFFGGGGGASPFGGGGRGPAGPPRGQDMEMVADVSFYDSVFGAQIPVEVRLPQRCGDCNGSGAGQGTRPVTCNDCGGAGQVRRVRQSVLGQMMTTSPCSRCGGMGEIIATPCETCRGEGRVTTSKTYTVDIPAGVVDGTTLRLTGCGAAGPRGGSNGDLYVHLRVGADERFHRDDDDILMEITVSVAQAALGTQVVVSTLDGDEDLVVPPGTQPGRQFVIKGRGVPRLRGRGRGDLKVITRVEIPTKLDKAEVQLLRDLAERRGEVVGDGRSSFFDKIKSKFT